MFFVHTKYIQNYYMFILNLFNLIVVSEIDTSH